MVFFYNPSGQITEEFLNLPVHLGYLGTLYVKCCVKEGSDLFRGHDLLVPPGTCGE